MAQFKYIKHGVKRKHEIIEGILLLERIAQFEGIQKVVQVKISSMPKLCAMPLQEREPMSNSRLPVIALILGFLFVPLSWPQTDKELRTLILLVRAPDYDETCAKGDKPKAVSLGNEDVSGFTSC